MPMKRQSSSSSLNGALADMLNAVTVSTGNFVYSKPKQTTGPSTELSLDEFDDFLSHTLSKEDVDMEELMHCTDGGTLNEALPKMEHGLNTLLKSKPDLPTPVVAQLHTYLGLVYLEQNNNNSAVDSFMRAIWFQSRTPEDTLAIAQANHRLGLAYGRKKEYQQAMDLMDRALRDYDTSSEQYILAKEDRHEFQEAQQLELLAKRCPDMEQKVAENQRTSRRRRRTERAAKTSFGPRRKSFNNGLTDILKAARVQAPGLNRTYTTPAQSPKNSTLAKKAAGITRQSTSPVPKKSESRL